MKCSSCQRRHHSSICENAHTLSDVNPARPAVSTPSNTQANPAQVKTVALHHPSSLSMYVSTTTPVLLQTVRAMVFRPDSPTIAEITDGGSQCSYITGRLREALTLPTQSSESLVIKMFGSEGGRAQTCDVVRLGGRTRDGAQVDLKLLVVPLICEPLSGKPVSCAIERLSHLFELEMADTSTLGDTLDIDVLIGADLGTYAVGYLDPQELKQGLDGCYPVPYQDTVTNIRRSTCSHLMFFKLIQPQSTLWMKG